MWCAQCGQRMQLAQSFCTNCGSAVAGVRRAADAAGDGAIAAPLAQARPLELPPTAMSVSTVSRATADQRPLVSVAVGVLVLVGLVVAVVAVTRPGGDAEPTPWNIRRGIMQEPTKVAEFASSTELDRLVGLIGDVLVVLGGSGELVGLDINTGALLWQAPGGTFLQAEQLGAMVIALDSGNRLHRFDGDGQLLGGPLQLSGIYQGAWSFSVAQSGRHLSLRNSDAGFNELVAIDPWKAVAGPNSDELALSPTGRFLVESYDIEGGFAIQYLDPATGQKKGDPVWLGDDVETFGVLDSGRLLVSVGSELLLLNNSGRELDRLSSDFIVNDINTTGNGSQPTDRTTIACINRHVPSARRHEERPQ
jgi:hypothetical protein